MINQDCGVIYSSVEMNWDRFSKYIPTAKVIRARLPAGYPGHLDLVWKDILVVSILLTTPDTLEMSTFTRASAAGYLGYLDLF